MVLNEHHQNIYGLMPSPNMIAAALTQNTSRGKIIILGNLLPLHLNPMRVAEEYAMLDQMSNGRLVAGFAPGGGPETFNYDVPSANTREKFWEAADLIVRSWTEDGPFAHEGRYFPLRYVNLWPKPLQKPFPPVWIPGSRSPSTMTEVAKRGYCYFLSSRSHGGETHRAQQEFAAVLEKHGDKYHPFRFGILMSTYVAETDQQAREECEEGVWYFLKNCLKGHLRRVGRQLTYGPGVPYIPAAAWREYHEELHAWAKTFGRRGKLGRARSIAVDHRRQPGNGHAAHSKPHRKSQGRQSVDSVPARQHARPLGAQKHEALRGKSRAGVAPRFLEAIHRGISRHQPRAIGGGSPLSGRDHRR